MGKPKCTQELIDRAVKLKKGGAANKDIASGLCINERTLYKWLNDPKSDKQRQLGQELKKVEADYKNVLLGIIMRDAHNKDWKAAAWILERKYPEEYGSPAHRLMIAANKNTEKADAEVLDYIRSLGLE